jgi:uncharacterized membrane-anchored protein
MKRGISASQSLPIRIRGERRLGRIIQRLCEIETYKSLSMQGFATAREIQGRMGQIDAEITDLMKSLAEATQPAETTLAAVLRHSAELESLDAQVAFRFGATWAYQAIVDQRIAVLREERFKGRQTFYEFMMRRYDPAMRTVRSTETRLNHFGGPCTSRRGIVANQSGCGTLSPKPSVTGKHGQTCRPSTAFTKNS